jgi:hypothetical protein
MDPSVTDVPNELNLTPPHEFKKKKNALPSSAGGSERVELYLHKLFKATGGLQW